ncbi:hypothetical protein QFC20_002882 [Naganishia adeliensis]|uniref:Uncharacterized protein n=1 Tax=Naganishia adeliensis TaxID=92952 RepID=A0ACC2WGM5_9TREE|nr:hypothetical protein QFC20_002882 [Naganishia adeliensis]
MFSSPPLNESVYAPVPEMKKWTRMQVTTLRYLAQDLLSELVGGNQREDDAIYAMYVFSEDENASPERNAEELARDDGPNEEEEAQSKAMMEIIEIDDD